MPPPFDHTLCRRMHRSSRSSQYVPRDWLVRSTCIRVAIGLDPTVTRWVVLHTYLVTWCDDYRLTEEVKAAVLSYMRLGN